MRTILMVMATGAASLVLAAPAQARPGCVSQYWLYEMRGTTRTICDGPRLADGSWNRAREFYSPARYVPMTCNWNSYGGYCSGGYNLPELEILTVYPVTDATVLGDEPGHIEP